MASESPLVPPEPVVGVVINELPSVSMGVPVGTTAPDNGLGAPFHKVGDGLWVVDVTLSHLYEKLAAFAAFVLSLVALLLGTPLYLVLLGLLVLTTSCGVYATIAHSSRLVFDDYRGEVRYRAKVVPYESIEGVRVVQDVLYLTTGDADDDLPVGSADLESLVKVFLEPRLQAVP